jgi:Mrp family chromosome partitioning ATPase
MKRSAVRQIAAFGTIAIGVFVAALLYAFLAKATYQAQATVALDFPKDGRVPPPAETTRLLEGAVLDPAALETLASRAPGNRTTARGSLREAARLSSGDGRVYTVAFRDGNAARAHHMANALARRAVEVTPRSALAVALRKREPTAADAPLKVRILKDATRPKSPVSPRRMLVLLWGAGSGLILGLVAALAMKGLRKRGARPAGKGKAASPAAPAPLGRDALVVKPLERRIGSQVPTLIGTSPLELAVASFAAERAKASGDSEIELPPPTPKVLPELAQALEAWRSSSKVPVAQQVDGSAAPVQVVTDSPQPTPAPSEIVSIGASPAGAGVGTGTELVDYTPPSRPRRRRPGSGGTLMMGSFAPRLGENNAAPQRSTRPPVAETTYRYSSAPPPAPAEQKRDPIDLNLLRPPPGWVPDPDLMLPIHKNLREQLCSFALEKCFTVVVSSPPDLASAKSRHAAGLAMTLAEMGHPRILLMEGNFHYPMAHRLARVEVPVTLGFSQQLHSRVHADATKKWSIVGCSPTLHVLGEGVLRSPGMMLSKQFERSLQELEKYYDLIIIDGPDTSFEFDCRALDSLAGGLVFVSRSPEAPMPRGTSRCLLRNASPRSSRPRTTATVLGRSRSVAAHGAAC